MKEIEDDTNKWKDTTCSCLGRINMIKMAMFPMAIYRIVAIHIKIPMAFHISRTNNSKIRMETKETLNSLNNLEEEKRSWRDQAP